MGGQLSTHSLIPQILRKYDASERKVNWFASLKTRSVKEKLEETLLLFLVSYYSFI